MSTKSVASVCVRGGTSRAEGKTSMATLVFSPL